MDFSRDFNIDLWDYQQEAIDNMYGENGIYEKQGRIAEVILPTGAGKSFVAMQAVINEMTGKVKSLEEIEENGCISDVAIGYLAPTNLILYQFRLHMVRFIVEKMYTKMNLPEGLDIDIGEVDLYVSNIFNQIINQYIKNPKEKITIQTVSDEELIGLNPKERIKKIVDKNIQLLSADNLKKIISTAFPNFILKCYDSTIQKEKKDGKDTKKDIKGVKKESKSYTKKDGIDQILNIEKEFQDWNVDFLITDEAHMGGAEKWQKALKKFIQNNPKTKILGITATPSRNSDEEDILRTIAREEGQEEYIAQAIYLLEAMEKEMVVTPQIKFFPCLLDETKEYLDVMNNYLKAYQERLKDSSSKTLKVYETILTEMHKAMGMDKEISDKLLKFSTDEIKQFHGINSIDELPNRAEWQEIKKKKVEEIIYPDETENPNRGKSIVFVPQGRGAETTESVVKKYIEKFTAIFHKDKISSIKPYHSIINSPAQNEEVLNEFNYLGEQEDSGIVAIVTNKMADQGFHPENIKNLMFMDRISAEEGSKKKKATDEINPKAIFVQKIGRGIFGILNKKRSEYKIPVYFDFANNFGRHKEFFVDKENGKNLLKLPRNIQYFFEMAEIGKKAWMDYTIKQKMKPDGTTYVTGFKFSARMKKANTEIDYIDCSDTGNIDVLGFTGEATEKKRKKYDPVKTPDKWELLLKTLEELKKLNIDYTKISAQTIINEDFFKSQEGITEEQIKDFYSSLESIKYYGMQNYEYHIGEALNNFREGFWRTGKVSQKFSSVFDDYTDYEKLVELGIIVVDLDNIPENLRGKVRSDGFIKVNNDMPEHAIGINVKTGNKFDENGKDEFGCREDGLDDQGYDKTKFNKKHFHKKTKCQYDERYFYLDDDGTWKNKWTGTELDVFGYNHEGINPETGFDRGNFDQVGNSISNLVHLWHKKTEDGYSRIGKVYSEDDDGKKISDFHGFESGKGARQKSTGSITTPSGFFRDRTTGDRSYFKYDEATKRLLTIDRVDEAGFYFPMTRKKGEPIWNVLTSSPYGLGGKDVNGEYPAEFKIGVSVCKSLLKGKKIEDIQKEFTDTGVDLNEAIGMAFEHFLMYAPFLELDNEIKYLHDQIKNNQEIIDGLGKISEVFKNQIWNMAVNENLARQRSLSYLKIEQTKGGGKSVIEHTVNANVDLDDEGAR